MSCHTAYIVREPDGRLWSAGARWGHVHFDTPTALLAHLRTMTPTPLAGEVVNSGLCRGWYVDLKRRFARVYLCLASEPRSTPLEVERRLRGWAGWDAGVAVGGRAEIRALAGRARPGKGLAALDRWTTFQQMGSVAYDPERFPHAWVDGVLVYPWCISEGALVSVIDPEGQVRDHGFDGEGQPHDVVLAALGQGPRWVESAAAETPMPHPSLALAGAVIDATTREITLWFRYDPVPVGALDAIRARWLGWSVQVDLAGLAGHLQRTGRIAEVHEWGGWPEDDLPYPRSARAFSYVPCRTGEP